MEWPPWPIGLVLMRWVILVKVTRTLDTVIVNQFLVIIGDVSEDGGHFNYQDWTEEVNNVMKNQNKINHSSVGHLVRP